MWSRGDASAKGDDDGIDSLSLQRGRQRLAGTDGSALCIKVAKRDQLREDACRHSNSRLW